MGLISASFGSKVNYSQVTRALWSVLAGAEDSIRAESKRAPNLRVPSKGDHIGMAEYEEAIADFLAMAPKRSYGHINTDLCVCPSGVYGLGTQPQ